MDDLKAKGAISFDVDGVTVSLAEEDLLIAITQKEGYVTEADNAVTVVLNTNLTEELIEEGFMYEVISKIQTMRKDSGFEVMDRIKVVVSGSDKVSKVVLKNKEAIATKVLATEISDNGTLSNMKEWNVNGENVTIGVERV